MKTVRRILTGQTSPLQVVSGYVTGGILWFVVVEPLFIAWFPTIPTLLWALPFLLVSALLLYGGMKRLAIDKRRWQEQLVLLNTIVDSATDAVFVKDTRGRYIMINSAGAGFLGKTASEVVGKADHQLFSAETARRLMQEDLQVIERAQAQTFDTYATTAMGQQLIFHTTKVPYRDAVGKVLGVIGIARDITERQKMEDAYHKEKEFLKTVVDQLPIMMNWFDKEGKTQWVNREFERVLGWTEEEAKTVDLITLSYPDPDERRRVIEFIHEANTEWGEFHIRTRDGTVLETLWSNVRLSDGSCLGFGQNITENRRLEQAVRDSEAHFRNMAETVPDMLFTTDPNGKINYVNRQYTSFTGLPSSQASETDWVQAIHPDDVEPVLQHWHQALDSGTPYRMELRLRSSHGVYRWFITRARPIRNEQGIITQWFGCCTDINELKRTEKTLREQAERLAELDRRKDEFLAMLGHELRNPLAPIRNAVEILKLQEQLDPNLEWVTGIIDRQVTHLAHLVDDLLDVARITRGQIELRKQPLVLAEMVKRSVELTRHLIDSRHQRLEIVLPEQDVYVLADPDRLIQILSNLLHNAAKYTDESGWIQVEVQLHNSEASLHVRDNGIGMSRELLNDVFDLFVQAERSPDRAQGGLGLGLTLVRRLTEMHGGRVQAISEGIGCGSEFIVYLPLPDSRTAAKAPAKDTPAPNPSPVHRILIIEDNPDNAQSIAKLLHALGQDTCIAHDGASALELCPEYRPDIVIMDIGLPDMDGYELAQRLPRNDRTPFVLVALSGYGRDEKRLLTVDTKFDHHLLKPVSIAELKNLLAATIR